MAKVEDEDVQAALHVLIELEIDNDPTSIPAGKGFRRYIVDYRRRQLKAMTVLRHYAAQMGNNPAALKKAYSRLIKKVRDLDHLERPHKRRFAENLLSKSFKLDGDDDVTRSTDYAE